MVSVLFAAAEAAPFIKTGGLADVVGSLPKELRRRGIDARLILPKYDAIAGELLRSMKIQAVFEVPVGWRRQYCGILAGEENGVPVYLIDNEYYFKRQGIYGHYDDGERFAYFCRAVLEALPNIDFFPDVLHSHDWHAAMVSPLLKAHYGHDGRYGKIGTLFTIHNLKYQGVFPKDTLGDLLGMGWEHFTPDGVEFYDSVNFMKGGINYADAVSTVSKTYAQEIQHPFFGEQLDGLLTACRNKLYGIINGIDAEWYNPATDKALFANYDRQDWLVKRHNKEKLQEMLGLPVAGEKPLIAIISRLVEAKGFDLVGRVLYEILADDVQLVVLGSGEERYQHLFQVAAWLYPEKVAVRIGFDENLARKVYGAADLFLMPSLYEPCGLSQMIAMRYGCLPVVRETGGLKDTVRPYNEYTGQGTGFSFANYNAHDMLYTVRRALDIYKDSDTWGRVVKNAMSADYSWQASAAEYEALYERLVH